MTSATVVLEEVGAQVWDVIVLGAGPAGALAARELAIGGARVLLVDRKSFPRRKVCGACLNGTAIGVLESIGLGSLPHRLGGIEIEALELACSGRSTRLNVSGGIAVSRPLLDDALAEAAITEGADFLPGTEGLVSAPWPERRDVLLTQGSHTVTAEARVVLVATGLGATRCASEPVAQNHVAAHSRIGAGCTALSFPSFYHPKVIFMAVGQGGYVGLVRVENDSLNVAAAFDREFVKAWGGAGAAAVRVLCEAGFPPVPELQTATWQGTLALTRQSMPPAAERVFLLGDATGYVEPFTGEGMAWALMSSRAVGPLARRGIQCWSPSLAREWAEIHNRLILRRQRLCRGLATVLRHPWVTRASLEFLKRFPELGELIIGRLNSAPVFSQSG
jgi:menaquinone-9 beta-reductase